MGLAPVRIRYVVTVDDVGPPHLTLKTVRRRRFRHLDAARRYEGRMCRKAMKREGVRTQINNWGSVVHRASWYDPVRLVTITCETR